MAQEKTAQHQDDKDYIKNPEWIKMIDNPSVNYYDALNAYESYWKVRIKPEREEELINEYATRKEKREHRRNEKQLAKMTPAERAIYDNIVYQCKRFETWQREVQPYVQNDGRILSQQERVDIWNKQQEEIKNQNK